MIRVSFNIPGSFLFNEDELTLEQAVEQVKSMSTDELLDNLRDNAHDLEVSGEIIEDEE